MGDGAELFTGWPDQTLIDLLMVCVFQERQIPRLYDLYGLHIMSGGGRVIWIT